MPLTPLIDKLRVHMGRPQAQDLVFAVAKHLGGDPEKTIAWFETSTPKLFGMSPLELIQHGQEERLRALLFDERERKSSY